MMRIYRENISFSVLVCANFEFTDANYAGSADFFDRITGFTGFLFTM